MLGKILGIDISEEGVAAVLVRNGLQGSTVLSCAHSLFEDDSVAAKVSAIAGVLEEIDLRGTICLCAIPASYFSFRVVALPFKDVKKIEQVLPYEIEAALLDPVDLSSLDFLIIERGAVGSKLLAASIHHEVLREHINLLAENNLQPEKLSVRNVSLAMSMLSHPETEKNGLLLDIGGDRATMICFVKGRVVLLRRLSLHFNDHADKVKDQKDSGEDGRVLKRIDGARRSEAITRMVRECSHTFKLFEVETGIDARPQGVYLTGEYSVEKEFCDHIEAGFDQKVHVVNLANTPRLDMGENMQQWKPELMNNALSLALHTTSRRSEFDFLKGEFEVKKPLDRYKKEIRKVVLFLVAIAAIAGGNLHLELNSLESEYSRLNSQVLTVFKEAMPTVSKIVDPVHQLRTEVNALKSKASTSVSMSETKMLALLDDISGLIPEKVDVRISRMVADRESIRLKGQTDNFNSVDTIKKGLERSKYFSEVTISSANMDRSGGKINFELRLSLVK